MALTLQATNYPPAASVFLRDWAILFVALLIVCEGLAFALRDRIAARLVAGLLAVWLMLYPALAAWVGPLHLDDLLFAFLLLLAIVSLSTLLKTRGKQANQQSLHKLVAISTIPLLLTAALVVPMYLQSSSSIQVATRPMVFGSTRTTPQNIYQIVLDGLGRQDVLWSRYGLDLRPFSDALTRRGFVTYTCASANYAQTYLSLSSMLNAEYFQNLVQIPQTVHSRVPAHRLIDQSRVVVALKQKGYRIQWIGSGYSATAAHPLADKCRCSYPLFGEFEDTVFDTTGLGRIVPLGIRRQAVASFVNEQLDELLRLRPIGDRTFTFFHVMAPHPPFVFTNGGTLQRGTLPVSFLDGSVYPGSEQSYRDGYTSQARYLLGRVLEGIDQILASDKTAVIILHGDHGPRYSFDATNAELSDPSESLPIFLAIRGPEVSPGSLQQPLTLVNVYRNVLSAQLGAVLPPLQNRSYLSSFTEPYKWIEATVPCPVVAGH